MFKSKEPNVSINTLKSPNPEVSSTFKNSRKNPSTLGMLLGILTQRTIRVICSSWLTSRVQSKIIKKYLASLMILKIELFTASERTKLTHSEYCGQDNDDEFHYFKCA